MKDMIKKDIKERGIIFTTDMVRAIPEGRKTQTRRLNGLKEINREPDNYENPFFNKVTGLWEFGYKPDNTCEEIKCPYGQVGDRLYVRESYRLNWRNSEYNITFKTEPDKRLGLDVLPFFANPEQIRQFNWSKAYNLSFDWEESKKWRSAIYLPKWAARIWLEITGIRVERVQDISVKDIRAEGVLDIRTIENEIVETYYEKFKVLWDSINAKRGYGWDENPLVWVIEFKKILK